MSTRRTLQLSDQLFPQTEVLSYQLKMLGAKGSLQIRSEKAAGGVDLRCQILASLILPPKKLVDSDLASRLEPSADGVLQLVRHTDNDFKSESRRTLELKAHSIETRYKKFEEERGFIDYPQGVSLNAILDPLSAAYMVRDPEFLSRKDEVLGRILIRSGVLEVLFRVIDERDAEVPAMGAIKKQIRIEADKISGDELKGPYLSKALEIWLDAGTGIITEINYPLFGNFGRVSLVLDKRD